MTHEEKVAAALEVIDREAGPLAGELAFEFMRAAHSDGFIWSHKFCADSLFKTIDSFQWSSTPQGHLYWAEMAFAVS